MSRFSMRKLNQWEALLVARTENPSVSAWPSEISLLTIGAATKVTVEGVVCRINLFSEELYPHTSR